MVQELKQDNCPFCGGADKTMGKSIFEGSMYLKNRFGDFKPHEMIHELCTACGSILRSRVQKEALCSCDICKTA